MTATLTAGSTPAAPKTTTRKPRRKPQRFVRRMFDLPTAGEIAVRIREVGPRSEREDWYFVGVLPSAWGFATFVGEVEAQARRRWQSLSDKCRRKRRSGLLFLSRI